MYTCGILLRISFHQDVVTIGYKDIQHMYAQRALLETCITCQKVLIV